MYCGIPPEDDPNEEWYQNIFNDMPAGESYDDLTIPELMASPDVNNYNSNNYNHNNYNNNNNNYNHNDYYNGASSSSHSESNNHLYNNRLGSYSIYTILCLNYTVVY